MILVDTSIWIDHVRARDETLANLLNSRQVLIHPFVIGELALGNLRARDRLLTELMELPRTKVAMEREVLWLIDQHKLFGEGIGYVDACLLATVRLTPGASLWTRDRRLLGIADRLGLATGWIR